VFGTDDPETSGVRPGSRGLKIAKAALCRSSRRPWFAISCTRTAVPVLQTRLALSLVIFISFSVPTAAVNENAFCVISGVWPLAR
jgi:hypothetical protein